jgi:chemotaxis protein methyltransferase CheR
LPGGALFLPEFPERDFQDFCRLIQGKAGICLPEHKKELLRSRLSKLLRDRPIASLRDYFRQVIQDESGRELAQLLDAVSTNQTAFLREPPHFQFLAREVLPALEQGGAGRRLSLWSAGCSSGEEPYTLAMILLDAWGERARSGVRIYASDLSTQVLAQARRGIYPEARLEPVPPKWRRRFFQKGVNRCQGLVRVKPEVQKLVTFFHFNLMAASFPFQAELDIIFCRNVMIYFNKETQSEVVRKFHHCLTPGGYLFIGHSESLCNLNHRFIYVKPTIYRK